MLWRGLMISLFLQNPCKKAFITTYLLISKLRVCISLKLRFPFTPFQFICFATESVKILANKFHVTFLVF